MVDFISFVFVIFLYVLAGILLFSFSYDVPPVPSSFKSRKKAIELIKKYDTQKGDIVEIGTGWGGFAIMIAKEFPNRKIITYELGIVQYLYSKLIFKIKKISNIEIYRGDAIKELEGDRLNP